MTKILSKYLPLVGFCCGCLVGLLVRGVVVGCLLGRIFCCGIPVGREDGDLLGADVGNLLGDLVTGDRVGRTVGR